jgi:hypothetical protein
MQLTGGSIVFRRHTHRKAGSDCFCAEQPPFLIPDGLLVKIGVVVMMVPMMVMVVHVHHDLSVGHIGHCEAEKEN